VTGRYEAMPLATDSGLPAGKVSVNLPRSGRSFSGLLHLAGETRPVPLKGGVTMDGIQELLSIHTETERSGSVIDARILVSRMGEVTVEIRRDGQLMAETQDGMRLLEVERGMSAAHAGRYTGLLEGLELPGVVGPEGIGWFSATGSRTGRLSLRGSLGDGTTFTSSVEADLAGQPGFRLFVQPYRPARAHSWMGGIFHLEPSAAGQHVFSQLGVHLHWRKVALPGDTAYRNGFGPIGVRISLYPWLAPSRAAGLAERLDTPSGQWNVWHSDTGSTSGLDLPNLLEIRPNNRLQVLAPLTVPPNIRRWRAVVEPRTGVFQGGFELQDPLQTRKVPFAGVLRQVDGTVSSVIGGGRYLLPPLRTTENGETRSGAMRFSRQ